MSSSTADNDGNPSTSIGEVVVDPEAVLVREPGLIVDPRFLAPLRDELTAELGPEGATTALMQIGCMHGLRDAEQVVNASFAGASAGACLPGSAALPLRLLRQTAAPPDAELILVGSWPEAAEAQAWLAHRAVHSQPVCAVSAGYTSGWLSALMERDVVAIETECVASGAVACRFSARERLAVLAHGDPRSIRSAEALPVAALRAKLAQPLLDPCLPDPQAADGEEAVIHIWGPVMVIPFCGLDEALQAVELLRSDSAATRVSVVVMDLTGAVVDEAFGAAVLEQIIDFAAACGAETVLAGVSPLSEQAVAGLENPPVLVCKDLHAGIAAGFQVANSQEHLL
jgi:hypothetical protein